MSQDQIQQVQVSVQQCEELVGMRTALERLQHNADFVKIINTGFLTNEAVRLVHAKADPQCQTAETQAAIIRDIDAIGTLNSYFRNIYQNANAAENALAQHREELVLLAQEEQERAQEEAALRAEGIH